MQFAVSMAELKRFKIKCVSHGLHIYWAIRKLKLSELLEVFQEQGNIHDPFSIAFKVKSAAILTKAVIGHIPREISWFCWYFMIYCGFLEARVRDAVCRISPNLNRGHEIPITLILKKFQQTERFFEKWNTSWKSII